MLFISVRHICVTFDAPKSIQEDTKYFPWIHQNTKSPVCYQNYLNSNYENNQQDALYRLIYYSKSALQVSGDVFAHHQEHLSVFTVSGSVHPRCCVDCETCTRLTIYIVQFQLIRDNSRQQLGWILPDSVNRDKCSWWWEKVARNM
jgi:hypothetical protein